MGVGCAAAHFSKNARSGASPVHTLPTLTTVRSPAGQIWAARHQCRNIDTWSAVTIARRLGCSCRHSVCRRDLWHTSCFIWVGVTHMMKEHFGIRDCRTAAILSALLFALLSVPLCGQGQAILFAQQSSSPSVTAGPNTASAPNQTQGLRAPQQRDQDLGREIQQQFATDGAFQSIAVTVSNGVVVLEGPVASKRDRWRAVHMVKVLPNVARIDDRLTISARAVAGATASTDTGSTAAFDSTTSKAAEVANEIIVALRNEPTLASSRVNVTVAGDRIELTGTVGSKEQREKAREIAKAFAVHSHVVDKLTIAAHDISNDRK